MRNLKKILALVLALMMTLSLMVTASASSYSDAGKIDADYEEAIDVLTGIGIYRGNDKGEFLPDTTLNRKDAAALVYRVISGDVGDKYLSNYKGYASEFTDVPADSWYAPYVGFAANGGYIKGDGKGHFNPDAPITGTEVLTILLRAVGYDQNGEFSKDWPLTVATLAKQLGITDTVGGVVLTKAVSREVVAELIFQTITTAKMVNYTPAFGYQPITLTSSWGVIGASKTVTLGQKIFNLAVGDYTDTWGRPGHVWTYKTGDKKTVIMDDYIVAYHTAVTECQVAADYGFEGTKTLKTYINGYKNPVNTTMQATDTVGTIGEQGRLTEVYADRIVMIDTYLAYVAKVSPAVYDKAGHLKDAAYSKLTVYDRNGGSEYKIDEIDYSKGSYILLNAVTTAWNSKQLETGDDKYYEVVGVAPSFVGAQSTIWVNAKQHIIDGTTYDDAYNFILDEAGSVAKKNFTWFKDQYGNVIGSIEIVNPKSYAVLTSLYWNTGRPGYATATLLYVDGTTAEVKVNAIAGDEDDDKRVFGGDWNDDLYEPMSTDGTIVSPKFDGDYAFVSEESRHNGMYNGYALYEVETLSDGFVNLSKTEYLAAGAAQVVNKGTEITVSSTPVANRVYVDDGTVFIVYESATSYARYVGKDNVPTFTSTTDSLFYVDVDGDKVAEYVYVNNGKTTDAGKALVAATKDQYAKDLWNNKTTVYVLRYAEVNGAAVEAGKIMSKNEDLIKKLANNVNKLYVVIFDDDGFVVDVKTVGYSGFNDGNLVVYRLDEAEYTAKNGTLIGEITISGTATTKSWNTSGKDLYGNYSDLADVDFDEVYTYVVLDALTGALKAVYVYDKPEGANNTPGKTDVTYGVELTAEKKLVVTRYEDGVATADGTNSTSFTYETYTSAGILAANGSGSDSISASSKTKTIDLSSALVSGDYYVKVVINGQTYTTNALNVAK